MEVKTIWELFLFQVRPSVALERFEMGIFSFLAERHWSRNSCHGNGIKGVILFLLWCTVVLPSFKNTAAIFPEISFIQYFPLFSCKHSDVITGLICIKEKCQYLKRKKIFQKENRYSSAFWKAFQISTNYFSFHRHFNCDLQFCTIFWWYYILTV